MFQLNSGMTYPALQALGIMISTCVVCIILLKVFDCSASKGLSDSFCSKILVCCIIAPFAEELLFRLPLLLIMKLSNSDGLLITATIIASVIFGLAHVIGLKDTDFGGALGVFLLTTCIAMALSRLVVQTGSVVPAMLIHATYNFLVLLYVEIAEEFS